MVARAWRRVPPYFSPLGDHRVCLGTAGRSLLIDATDSHGSRGGEGMETGNLSCFGLRELIKVCIRNSEALEPVRSVAEGDKGLLGRIRVTPVVHSVGTYVVASNPRWGGMPRRHSQQEYQSFIVSHLKNSSFFSSIRGGQQL